MSAEGHQHAYATCPVCAKRVLVSALHDHVDYCLEKHGETVAVADTGAAPRHGVALNGAAAAPVVPPRERGAATATAGSAHADTAGSVARPPALEALVESESRSREPSFDGVDPRGRIASFDAPDGEAGAASAIEPKVGVWDDEGVTSCWCCGSRVPLDLIAAHMEACLEIREAKQVEEDAALAKRLHEEVKTDTTSASTGVSGSDPSAAAAADAALARQLQEQYNREHETATRASVRSADPRAERASADAAASDDAKDMGDEDVSSARRPLSGAGEAAWADARPRAGIGGAIGGWDRGFGLYAEPAAPTAATSPDRVVVASSLTRDGTLSDGRLGRWAVSRMVAPAEAAYADVLELWCATGSLPDSNVVAVWHIENRGLAARYALLREQMAEANAAYGSASRGVNEQRLWHGTSFSVVPQILEHGFNRSYCGKNATAYGAGVYFSSLASTSQATTFSPPNVRGLRHVLLSRVLVGDYARGTSSLKAPPARPASEYPLRAADSAAAATPVAARFDSVVNRIDRPSIFVIFNDNQALPEYVISFRDEAAPRGAGRRGK